jgi:hypothetical protein
VKFVTAAIFCVAILYFTDAYFFDGVYFHAAKALAEAAMSPH